MGDAPHELRPHAVAHGKKKHGEENRLDLGGDGDVQLSDEHPHQQGARHRTQAEVADFNAADIVAQGQRYKKRQRDIGSQDVDKPEFTGRRPRRRLGHFLLFVFGICFTGVFLCSFSRMNVIGRQQNPAAVV